MMGKIKDLSQGNLGDVARQQHRDQYATPLNGSSVGSGGMRFYGTGELIVENEGLSVTGMATITGALNVSGSTILSGATTIAGPTGVTGTLTIQGATSVTGDFTVTGPTKLNGVTDIGGPTKITGTLDVTGPMATKGTLSVEGITTLKNDLNVTAGGKITAGSVSIDPGYFSGAIRFSNGTALAATPNGAQIVSSDGSGAVVASSGQASVSVVGGGEVIATASGVTMNGIPTTTTGAANLHMDGSGRIFLRV